MQGGWECGFKGSIGVDQGLSGYRVNELQRW